MAEEEYCRLARPYDVKLLASLPPAEFHVLHVCSPYNFLRILTDYPVHAFNWDVRGTGNPSLAEGRALLNSKSVIGGMAHGRGLVENTPQQLAAEVIGLRAAMGRKGWMLGSGCTFPPETPDANIAAIRHSVEKEL
jgi:uroporphyrinogen decarboxylase